MSLSRFYESAIETKANFSSRNTAPEMIIPIASTMNELEHSSNVKLFTLALLLSTCRQRSWPLAMYFFDHLSTSPLSSRYRSLLLQTRQIIMSRLFRGEHLLSSYCWLMTWL